jgi:hypothetical protein
VAAFQAAARLLVSHLSEGGRPVPVTTLGNHLGRVKLVYAMLRDAWQVHFDGMTQALRATPLLEQAGVSKGAGTTWRLTAFDPAVRRVDEATLQLVVPNGLALLGLAEHRSEDGESSGASSLLEAEGEDDLEEAEESHATRLFRAAVRLLLARQGGEGSMSISFLSSQLSLPGALSLLVPAWRKDAAGMTEALTRTRDVCYRGRDAHGHALWSIASAYSEARSLRDFNFLHEHEPELLEILDM